MTCRAAGPCSSFWFVWAWETERTKDPPHVLLQVDSEFYQEGKDKDYYLNHGKVLKWWHGKGSLLDYTNPAAVTWWHSLMDNILDMGADGSVPLHACPPRRPFAINATVGFHCG